MPAPAGRIVLLVVSPRVAAGLLSWAAWHRLVTADAVLAAGVDDAWLEALEQAGVQVDDVEELPVAHRAGRLLELAEPEHEVVEAIESGDRPHLVEELGDLLLQVVFHARVGQEDAEAPFDVDEVAAGIVAKLVRRHPHVFADVEVDGAEQVVHNWEQIKAAEKQRDGLFDGIPLMLPALARAQKMLDRLRRSQGGPAAAEHLVAVAGHDPLARRLLDAVALAAEQDLDAEGVLRQALARLATAAGTSATTDAGAESEAESEARAGA